ncbi:MAG: NAD(P)-dependent oxidoreductase [Phycisphaerae bacterium]|nr:NAD(P)-dependent oxidoreductase [Phycisphaerae bacterium]
MKKDKVLVTGGAGFIGSVLVRSLLADGHRVCVLDNLLYGGDGLLGVWSDPGFSFVRGDVRDSRTVEELLTDVDAVVHLAAVVGDPACARHPHLAQTVNLDASLSLLEACRDSGVFRFVFASTCSHYGKMKNAAHHVDETSELKPVSLYAETKVAVEQAVLNRAVTRDLCATALRFATVYGVSPRMRFDLTVNEFTMEMLTRGHLVVFGEQFWRPYVHVADVAAAIKLVLEQPAEAVDGEVFNVGSTDQNFRKEQIVQMIRESHAPGAIVETVQRNEDPGDYRVSFAKIREKLGFEIDCTVEDGIAEVAGLIRQGVIADYDSVRYRNVIDSSAEEASLEIASACVLPQVCGL